MSQETKLAETAVSAKAEKFQDITIIKNVPSISADNNLYQEKAVEEPQSAANSSHMVEDNANKMVTTNNASNNESMEKSEVENLVATSLSTNQFTNLNHNETNCLNKIPAVGTISCAENESNEIRSEEVVEEQAIELGFSQEKCLELLEQSMNYKNQLEQLQKLIVQKENMIVLIQRENTILEKEKQAFRKEMEMANREKESTVIKFAMKEKLLIDAKKEKENIEKHLADAKKEVKNISVRFQGLQEEKSRMAYIIDEKSNEVRKYQRELEKVKAENGQLESRVKYHVNKLNMEIDAKVALEKKLEEERNAPNKLEEIANEKLKMEFNANTILLKHEIAQKTETIENLMKDTAKANELVKQLRDQLKAEEEERLFISEQLSNLQEEHNCVQNDYSNEMLHSAKLRGQLEELQVLKTQNTLNDEKISELNKLVKEMKDQLKENMTDLNIQRVKEMDLLNTNKEMSESIVGLQNQICLLQATVQGVETENAILKKEQSETDVKIKELEKQLSSKISQRNDERHLLTKHLSEKTKQCEMIKQKLEDVTGDFEATKNKHATVVRELQREIQKHKRIIEQTSTFNGAAAAGNSKSYCSNCQTVLNGLEGTTISDDGNGIVQNRRCHSRSSSHSGHSSTGSLRPSEYSESETVVSNGSAVQKDLKGPSKKHLVERILRLQQASARQTEKIDFLENHTLSLVSELQKKSKVVQHYMMRDQAGALTSSKSDQNKSELAKYGNGIMSAIYNGIKGDNKSMTLELSLEINKKLQAVLEDTLLKNITLKENLDVLGLEVDNLTRKLRRIERKE